MTDHVNDYVARRKALDLSFREQERVLTRYAEHADARGERFVRAGSALDWAGTVASVREARRRLHFVRGLAVFLHVGDNRHEALHRDALGRPGRHRPPRIPSPEEIRKIMTEALSLGPAGSLTPLTFQFIIGFVACTGLRRSEATGLLLGDLGPNGLLIRNAKNLRDRLVHLHESARRALDGNLVVRKRQGGPGETGPKLHDLRQQLCLLGRHERRSRPGGLPPPLPFQHENDIEIRPCRGPRNRRRGGEDRPGDLAGIGRSRLTGRPHPISLQAAAVRQRRLSCFRSRVGNIAMMRFYLVLNPLRSTSGFANAVGSGAAPASMSFFASRISLAIFAPRATPTAKVNRPTLSSKKETR